MTDSSDSSDISDSSESSERRSERSSDSRDRSFVTLFCLNFVLKKMRETNYLFKMKL